MVMVIMVMVMMILDESTRIVSSGGKDDNDNNIRATNMTKRMRLISDALSFLRIHPCLKTLIVV
jgi:hypothetical protein